MCSDHVLNLVDGVFRERRVDYGPGYAMYEPIGGENFRKVVFKMLRKLPKVASVRQSETRVVHLKRAVERKDYGPVGT